MLGADEAEQLSPMRLLCSELMQLKMQIQVDSESLQNCVRLVKAKGSPKDCLIGGSLIFFFWFHLTFLFVVFQKFT